MTVREHVLALRRQGLTDQQIADRLRVSVRAVELAGAARKGIRA